MAAAARKPARPQLGNGKPALGSRADSAVQPSVPSSTQIEQEAAWAIGYQAGLQEGMKIGAERERTAAYSEENINDRIERLMANEVRPRALKALDRVVSWLLYSIGVASVVAAGVIVWRLSKWI